MPTEQCVWGHPQQSPVLQRRAPVSLVTPTLQTARSPWPDRNPGFLTLTSASPHTPAHLLLAWLILVRRVILSLQAFVKWYLFRWRYLQSPLTTTPGRAAFMISTVSEIRTDFNQRLSEAGRASLWPERVYLQARNKWAHGKTAAEPLCLAWPGSLRGPWGPRGSLSLF